MPCLCVTAKLKILMPYHPYVRYNGKEMLKCQTKIFTGTYLIFTSLKNAKFDIFGILKYQLATLYGINNRTKWKVLMDTGVAESVQNC